MYLYRMTPEDKQKIENEIKSNFSELKNKLNTLKSDVQLESDQTKKQEKNEEILQLETEISQIKDLIDKLSSLQEKELQSLKTRLESLKNLNQTVRWETYEILSKKDGTPITYELLKDSDTCNRLRTIIESNPKEFAKVPWESTEAKLEYIFSKIRDSVVLFLKNKLWNSENIEKIINNTIAPAFEWNLMEMLRDQWNENNISMLNWMNSISWDGLSKLVNWVTSFANKTRWSYNKFSQWVNALDYLSVHNWVLKNWNKSAVLSNPVEFQAYLNDPIFAGDNFSPYTSIDTNIFKVNENQNFELWISLQEKKQILDKIWDIKVVNNPKTTSLIVKMLDKPEKFFAAAPWLQNVANHLLDWVNTLQPVASLLWFDILWEVSKPPTQRSFICAIVDFVCKLIWIPWWLEWIVKKWRLDRLELTNKKNENISKIFEEYQKLAWKWANLSITDANSCSSALVDFTLTDLDKTSTTKWDYLRDVMAVNMDITQIPPVVVLQTLWNEYLKKETTVINWKTKEKIVVDLEKITDENKKILAHKHIDNMKTHFEKNYKDLKDFYNNIHNTDDLVVCMTASLYASKEDVIEWIKAKVFLPENYWVASSWNAWWESSNAMLQTWNSWNEWWNSSWEVWNNWWNQWWRENLDSAESSDKQIVSEQWVYDKAIEYGITDNRQIAYVLSTIKWECGFKNQKEIWWERKRYWKVDSTTWKAYYGRWFIQLTFKANYQKYTQIIRDSWKDFKDNDGNIIKWSEIDLVNNPDIILQSNDLAIFIAMDWMKNWWPGRRESQKLSYYINDSKLDFTNARRIINWTDKAKIFANDAQAYLTKLWNGSPESSPEKSDYLIWPKLLANNKDEIGWLWNSIMNWFQWGNNKSNFPNMDGAIWKNTRNHPHRFWSEKDVLSYKASHPNVKSFMFYFWANSHNNDQTISDITQWSTWLKNANIQPVLCTNIWADVKKTEHLQDLNQKLLALWKENNRPVIDFAKSYNKWEIKLNRDELHPTSYAQMTDIIKWQLS